MKSSKLSIIVTPLPPAELPATSPEASVTPCASGSASLPPVRHSAEKFAALHLPGAGPTLCPTTKTRPGAESKNFLGNAMNRPDLVDFMSWINEKIPIWDANINKAPSNWAFTGSVAIQIHGHALDCQIAKDRQPADVDVITMEFDLLDNARRTPDNRMTEHPEGKLTINVGTNASVDIINGRGKNRQPFGNLQKDMQMIHGVPVMSLAALLESKRFLLADGSGDGVQQGPDRSESALEIEDQTPHCTDNFQKKILSDIEIIKKLQDHAIPSHLKKSYEDIGFVQPPNIFA